MKPAIGKRKNAQRKVRRFALYVLFGAFLSACPGVLEMKVAAQTGGTYRIEKTVVAAGGARSAGGNYSLESTAGQPLAGGFLQNSGVSVYSGFRTPVFAPTAANVSIGGRVVTAGGQGIRNARVSLTAPDGSIRFAQTGSFGYYRFDDIPVGAVYVLSVSSRRFVFPNPTLVVNVTDEIANLDFIGGE